jgi:L-alanine-DL-glutamate epimerase-like enolase superfamily enzyme
MNITNIAVTPFRTWVDRYQNAVPKPRTEILQTLVTIETDEGVVGHYLGGQGHGDQDGLLPDQRDMVRHRMRDLLVGQDPFDRELFWQWMWASKTPENIMGVIDMALWDLAGRYANLPVAKLLGGCRDKVLAYASTYPNMGSIQNYVDHAIACRDQGYKAYKIHPYYFWNPVTETGVPGRPSHIAKDIELIHAVADAVGDDMVLMYDPWGTYHVYEEALQVGRELEKRNYHWYEHPMPEERVETYERLSRALDIPVCSPEILYGHVFTRADWIRRGVADISRIDVLRGGITGVKKTVNVCEAFGYRCEIHMSGIGNLHILGSTSEDTCEYYERGLLAPGVDYDAQLEYLNTPLDAMDAEGYVHLPQRPGLGYDLNWDYIREHLIDDTGSVALGDWATH